MFCAAAFISISQLMGSINASKINACIFCSLEQNNRRSVEWCEALHDFTAETKDDLSFKKGDYIQILEQVDSEWYRGRLNEKEGIFPAVFVQTCSGTVLLLDGKSLFLVL